MAEARHLLLDDLGLDRFITLLCARLRPATGEWTYINAGHPPGYILGPDGAVKAEMPPTTAALGIDRQEEPLTACRLVLEKGDLALLLTDGVAEARTPADEEFGEERAVDFVRRERNRPAAEIIDRLLDEAKRFSKAESLQDDMTVVAVKRQAG